tara:strand:- start:12719 stop:13456 length:738 start_codon:yes stop_codon:yes gene_type:complete
MKEVSLMSLVNSGLKDVFGIGEKNLLSYIETLDLNDQETKEQLVKYARSVATDKLTAVAGSPLPGTGLLQNIYTGDTGEYYGQNLSHLRQPNNMEYYNNLANIKNAPNLVDIFFEKTTPEAEGLTKTSLRPSQGYPFYNEGENVYGLKDYIDISPMYNNYQYLDYLDKKLSTLNPGEGTVVDKPNYNMSVDLGESNWSLGLDLQGNPYLAVADIWDFGGSTGTFGSVMDKLGKPINFYERFYLNE